MFRRGIRRATNADKVAEGHLHLLCGEANP